MDMDWIVLSTRKCLIECRVRMGVETKAKTIKKAEKREKEDELKDGVGLFSQVIRLIPYKYRRTSQTPLPYNFGMEINAVGSKFRLKNKKTFLEF